jgi:hypothetical protein
MLNRPHRSCQHCGIEMTFTRRSKTYCSEACRKKAQRGSYRGSDEQQIESRWIVECLRRMRLVGKIWPVFCWDDSPPIWALLVPFELATGGAQSLRVLCRDGSRAQTRTGRL